VLGTVFELDDGTQFGGEAFADGRFNVATSFYDITTPPLGIVAVVLMIVGPLLGWRDSNMQHLLRALRWPAVAAVVATVVALLIGVHDALPLAYVGLGVFAIGTNTLMIVRTLKGGWLRIGGYLAHIGVSIFLLGVVGSSVYASPDERLAFRPGETVRFQDYEFTFNNWKSTEEGGGVLDLTVQRGDEVFSAQPELYVDEQMGSTIQNPAIKSYIWEDLYIAPADYQPEFNPTRPVLGVGDSTEMGPYTVTFDGFEIDSAAMEEGGLAEVGARLVVSYEGEEQTVTPFVQLAQETNDGEPNFVSTPAALAGGESVSLVTFHPGQQLVMLQARGPLVDDLPVDPAQAVVTVSTKPLVLLVWVGLIVSVIGGSIALGRRYLEGRAALSGQPVRLPRGLPRSSGSGRSKWGWRGGSAAR
jgi:cytochrome c-type biogenesis protein CcmF